VRRVRTSSFVQNSTLESVDYCSYCRATITCNGYMAYIIDRKPSIDTPATVHAWRFRACSCRDEICFLYYPSRAAKHVETALGLQRPNGAVLQSDGYSVYAHYAKKIRITHAQCWAHARRKIFDARHVEPAQADQALHAIAALDKVEQQIRDDSLTGQAKLVRRHEQSKPVLERFSVWIDEQFDKQGFLPSSPIFGALAYPRAPGRPVGLRGRSGSFDRHKPPRARTAGDPDR